MGERKYRRFSREERLAAVKKVLVDGLSWTEVAREMGVRDTYLHGWRKAFEKDGTLQKEMPTAWERETELSRLREKVRQLTLERDALKRVVAMYIREHGGV